MNKRQGRPQPTITPLDSKRECAPLKGANDIKYLLSFLNAFLGNIGPHIQV